MLSVTTLDGTVTEALHHVQEFEMFEEVNGILEIAFNSLNIPENEGHKYLREESIVTANGYDFRVKQLETGMPMKRVVALSTYFDLTGVYRKQVYGGTHTLAEFLTFLYDGTGWSFEIEGISNSAFIEGFGDDNIINLEETICSMFECERKILPGNKVLFAKQVGPDNEAQYRYAYNVRALTEVVDTTNLRTRIEGRGADGLRVLYVSPNESNYGFIREAEPFEDDDVKQSSVMLEILRRELVDYPLVSFELSTLELTEKELGERVWLIYEPLNITFQTRVLQKVTEIQGRKFITKSVILGNSKPKSLGNILAEQNIAITTNNKQSRSWFDQTNEKIELGVTELEGKVAENTALISITAQEVRTEVSSEVQRLDGRVDTANATISTMAGQIALKADSSVTTSLGTRVSSAEINIDSLAGSISNKVSYTDYNGNTIASLINQSASTITLSAQAIDLLGITNVANTLYIGNSFQDSTPKSIQFRGGNGGVSISSPSLDNLAIGAVNSISFNSNTVNFSGVSSVVGLYARFG